MRTLDQFQEDHGAWIDSVFLEKTEAGMIAHLRQEVNEEIGVGCDPEELADAALLLLSLAHVRGFSLWEYMLKKRQENRERTWDKDGIGKYRHRESGG